MKPLTLGVWRQRTRRRLMMAAVASIVTGLVGVAFHLGGFALIRIRPAEAPARPAGAPTVAMWNPGADGDSVLADLTFLNDAEPLLLPTRWNAAPDLAAKIRRPSASPALGPFPPRTNLAEVTLPPQPRSLGRTIDTPIEGLALSPDWLAPAFDGAVEVDATAALPPRTAYLEIYDAAANTLVAEASIPPEALSVGTAELWRPAVFAQRIHETGPAGLPLLSQGTGNPDLTRNLRSILRTHPTIRALPPGDYRIVIGP